MNPMRKTDHYYKRGRQTGLSLIELMISLVLGLLVIGAVVQLFVGSSATSQSNEALARIQENARFSVETLKRELRDIGAYAVCGVRRPQTQNHLQSCGNPSDLIFAEDRGLAGWEFQGTGRGEAYTAADESALVPASGSVADWQAGDNTGGTVNLPAFLDGEVVPGSDVLIVRRPEVVAGVTGDGSTSQTDPNIVLDGNHGLAQNDFTLVTNCKDADLFQNRSTANNEVSANSGGCGSPGPGNQGGLDWETQNDDRMQVFRINVVAYYIGYDTSREEPGLYRAIITNGTNNVVREELVSGVESMQILYGYSLPRAQGGNGQTANFWLPGDEVPRWDFVIGARLALLVRSSDSMGDGLRQETFDLASMAFTHPQDARLRHTFLTTISLRNLQMVTNES